MSDEKVDHKAIYQAIENPIRKARYLAEHQHEIYPTMPVVDPPPPKASPEDMAAAAAYLRANVDDPMAAGRILRSAPHATVRGLEAVRGRRAMPTKPPNDNNPPPQAA